MKAQVKFLSGMKFSALSGSGHKFYMDSASRVDDTASAAMPLEYLLSSIAGCTGMDVVSILRKMRVNFDSFGIEIEADRAATHPKIFTKVDMKYIFRGTNLDEQKIKKAVALSLEVYCSAAAIVRATAQINYSIEINETD